MVWLGSHSAVTDEKEVVIKRHASCSGNDLDRLPYLYDRTASRNELAGACKTQTESLPRHSMKRSVTRVWHELRSAVRSKSRERVFVYS
jgi:hypothetical protein